MAKENLGKIMMLPNGAYNTNVEYDFLDIVTYNGGSYVCKKVSKGNVPTNGEYWQLIAEKGTKPVVGEDYFTDEDKENIKDKVIEDVRTGLSAYYDDVLQALPSEVATGTGIMVTDAKECRLINTNIKGKCVQDGEPTPTEPVEIEVISNEIELDSCGKNLIETIMVTSTKRGITCTNNGDGTFTINGTATDWADFRINQNNAGGTDNLKTYNGDYTLTCNELVTGVTISLMQNNTWVNCLTARDNKKSISSHIDNMDNMFVLVKVDEGTTLNNLVIRPMLEKGTTATNWEPYRGNSAPVSLQGNELCSIGDIKDELIINNDKVKIIKRIGKVVLNGSESWYSDSLHSNCTLYSFYTDTTREVVKPETQCLSNFLKYTSNNYSADNIGITINWQGNIRVKIGGEITTREKLISWLSENNLILYCILATPVEIDLGTLDKLPKTFDGVTNINVESNMNDVELDIEYVQDMKLYVNNLLNK